MVGTCLALAEEMTEVAPGMDNKAALLSMIQALMRGTVYFSRVIDGFYRLSAAHQKGLVTFLMEKCGRDQWKAAAQDDTRYLEVIRGALALYSGRAELEDPTRRDLAKLIGEYTKSPLYNEAEAIAAPSFTSFTEAL